MNRKENRGTEIASIYLWKLALIIVSIFAIVISIECFLLIEKDVSKVVNGISQRLNGTTTIVAENFENLENNTEGSQEENLTNDEEEPVENSEEGSTGISGGENNGEDINNNSEEPENSGEENSNESNEENNENNNSDQEENQTNTENGSSFGNEIDSIFGNGNPPVSINSNGGGIMPLASLTSFTITHSNIGYWVGANNYVLYHNQGRAGQIPSSASFNFWHAYTLQLVENNIYEIIAINDSENPKGGMTYNANCIIILDYKTLYWPIGTKVTLTLTGASSLSVLGTAANASGNIGTVTIYEEAEDPIGSFTPITNLTHTKDFIKLNLYDYNININDRFRTNANYPVFISGSTGNGTATSKWGFELQTFSMQDCENDIHNAPSDGAKINLVTSPSPLYVTNAEGTGMQKLLGEDGYPELEGNEEKISLSYLFQNGTGVTKANNYNLDGLLQKDDDDYYYFDSKTNFASFDRNTDTFKLYRESFTPNYIVYPFGNFLPFDSVENVQKVTEITENYFIMMRDRTADKAAGLPAGQLKNNYNLLVSTLDNKYLNPNATGTLYPYLSGLGLTNYYRDKWSHRHYTNEELDNLYNIDYDVPVNYWFGLEMEFDFIQKNSGIIKGNDMEYFFSGDDDVWVYIDNVLFLDLSGIHNQMAGKINFREGTVDYYGFIREEWTTDVVNSVKQETFEQILTAAGKNSKEIKKILVSNGRGGKVFPDDTVHNLKFYYLERGSGSSACTIRFNLEVLGQQDIVVEKQWDDTGTDRPESVHIDLLRNNTTYDAVDLSDENDWTHTFTGLIKYDLDGNQYTYEVRETPVNNYSTEYIQSSNENTINVLVKNTRLSSNVGIYKHWDDFENIYMTRPGSTNSVADYMKFKLLATVNNTNYDIPTTDSYIQNLINTGVLHNETDGLYIYLYPTDIVEDNIWGKEIELNRFVGNVVSEATEIHYRFEEVDIANDEYYENGIFQDGDDTHITNSLYRHIELTKLDDSDNTALQGARFKLEKQNSVGDWIEIAILNDMTDEDGKLYIRKLEEGNYRLTEIEAPEDYMLIPRELDVPLTNADVALNLVASDGKIVHRMDVYNRKKTILPNTGGIESDPRAFILITTSIIILAVLNNSKTPVLIRNRKRKSAVRRRK